MGLIRVVESLRILWFDCSSFPLRELSSVEHGCNYSMCAYLCVSAPMVNRSTKPNSSSKPMSLPGNVTGKVYARLVWFYNRSKRDIQLRAHVTNHLYPQSSLIMENQVFVMSMPTGFLPLPWPLPTRFQNHLPTHDGQKDPHVVSPISELGSTSSRMRTTRL